LEFGYCLELGAWSLGFTQEGGLMTKICFKEAIKKIKEPWQPHDLAYVNESALRIAKIQGAYDWHTHRDEDEFFMVLKGKIFIDTEAETIELKENEGYLVRRGTRHRSRAPRPAWILLIEPTKTKTRGEDSQ
jgi:mannose-6-phosphate isomerase-like protein (cupin superfamily)